MEAEAFSLWMKWLYTGRVFSWIDVVDPNARATERNIWQSGYMLADYLQDSDFKDAIIDAIAEEILVSRRPLPYLASWIYPYSTTGSAHRKMAVDLTVWYWRRTPKDMTPFQFLPNGDLPPQFLRDAIETVMPRATSGLRPVRQERILPRNAPCKYHDHGPNKSCYKTQPRFRY